MRKQNLIPNVFVGILILSILTSCGIKQKREAFPYSSAVRADSLGCFSDNTEAVVTLPAQPDNGSGVLSSDFDSDLIEGVGSAVSNPVRCSTLSPTAPLSDPLVQCQWHLQNLGQGIPSSDTSQEGGRTGADLKLFKKIGNQTLLEKFSGKGYKVHISDSGIEDAHEDLASNFNSELSYDFCTGDKKPEPRPKEGETKVESDHGTSVAGIIAAGLNNKGGMGITHEAKISADNAVSICDITAENWPKTLKQSGVDVWNGSFGTDTELTHEPNAGGYEIINDVIAGHIRDVASTDDTEMNPTAYFKAAGNEGYIQGNANRDPLGWNPWIAQIAAVDQHFEVTGYSSPGSNILVSAFGAGEGASPGICTTVFGNSYGCDFNGTSAATPQAAGVALMVKQAAAEKGKTLSPLDLYYILARTAVPVSETKEQVSGFTNKKYLNYSVNKAGYRHSVYYGFGIINAAKAVAMAQDTNYEPLPKLKSYSNTSKDNCSDLKLETNKTCVIRKISFDQDFQIFSTRVSIDVKPDFDSFSEDENIIGQVMAFLIQPDGTKSELIRSSTRVGGSVYTHNQFFKSYAPFASNAKGDWYVEVCAKGAKGGSYFFKNANIRHYGFAGEFPLAEKK
jgi:subtilisin family serine protease